MEKEKQIKKLTWKFFWEQKIKEVCLFIIIIPFVIFVPYWLGKIMDRLFTIEIPDNLKFVFWIFGLLFLMLAIVILYAIGTMSYEWIMNNWERAEYRAREKLIKSKK